MDPLQTQARRLKQQAGLFGSSGWTGTSQQVVITGGRVLLLSPAATDLKTTALRQTHHLMVVVAVAQGLAQRRIRFAEGHEGLERSNLLEELLQLGFGHGRSTDQRSDLIIRQRRNVAPPKSTSSSSCTSQPSRVSRGRDSWLASVRNCAQR